MLHVRGTVLPEREERSLWIDGGVLREDPVADAETVADGGWRAGRAHRGRAGWLGLPGLTDGAAADLVVFDEDPVAHPDVLHHPRRIILRGQILA